MDARMTHGRKLATVGMVSTTIALVATAPATAAPSLTIARDCYLPGQGMQLDAAGFTPGGDVVFSFSLFGDAGSQLRFSDPLKADASAGTMSVTFTAPQLASSDDGEEQLGISATDQTRSSAGAATGDESAFAMTALSAVTVDVDSWLSGKVRPGRLSRVHAYGFGAMTERPFTRGTLYAHYLRKKTLVKTAKVGVLQGPCGSLETKMRQFPFTAPPGSYTVDFDLSKTYDRKAPGIRYRKVPVPRSKGGRAASTLSVEGPERR
jgi:hypothetical protein